MKERILITTRDIVIPAFTQIHRGPIRTEYKVAPGEITIGINKDSTASFRVDLEEAIKDGLVAEVKQ